MNLASRSIMVPELFRREHTQVGLLLTDWLVFSNFLCTGIELCKSALSVPRQPFSALYARKAVAKCVPRFLNCAAKIESEMAISLCVCIKFSCSAKCANAFANAFGQPCKRVLCIAFVHVNVFANKFALAVNTFACACKRVCLCMRICLRMGTPLAWRANTFETHVRYTLHLGGTV